MKFAEGKTPVQWIVELDPRGCDMLQFRCKLVNYCENSDAAGEEELFSFRALQHLYSALIHRSANA
jgi:hypothetical protein